MARDDAGQSSAVRRNDFLACDIPHVHDKSNPAQTGARRLTHERGQEPRSMPATPMFAPNMIAEMRCKCRSKADAMRRRSSEIAPRDNPTARDIDEFAASVCMGAGELEHMPFCIEARSRLNHIARLDRLNV
jgi:hypothetical protein